MKIGFFDSGIGGLSVLHHAMQLLGNQEFIYYADEAHVPYGNRPATEILAFTRHAVEFMIAHGVCAVVIACNTATSAAAATLRNEFDIPIIGMEPAVREAMRFCRGKRILVGATPVTLAGKKFHDLVRSVDYNDLVDTVPLGELVSFAEQGDFTSDSVRYYLADQLSSFSLNDYGTMVLGCTHFNYFKDTLRSILGPSVQIIDGNAGTVRHLMHILSLDACPIERKKVEFYFSDTPITNSELDKIRKYMLRLDAMQAV